ncbi:MAG: GNAT family N-acetyltransferase [Methylomonas sp.]|nr:GNAT family N-acetyltransferase [Methylomonas sp.]
MDIPNYYVEPANYTVDCDALMAVRESVFVAEQGISPEVEFDTLDPLCHHFIARDVHGRPIGTGRLSSEGKIGRMGVLVEWRGQGVGASLLRTLLEKARNLGLTAVSANAQVAALGFYERFGFERAGEVFLEAGIPHQFIRLALRAVDNKPARATPKPRPASVPAVRLDTVESTLAASLQLINAARRQLYIFSRDLEYGLYGQNEIVEALKQCVLRNSNGVIELIIQEPAGLRSQTHPVLELAQRLPSRFSIRAPVEDEDLQYSSAFVVNDQGGYLFRLLGNRFEGHWSPNLPSQNQQLRDEFQRVWQRSRPCTEFRVLGL